MAAKKQTMKEVEISAPNMQLAVFRIVGTAPYVQLQFCEKAKNTMKDSMRAGSQGKKGKKREPRDFEKDYQQAMHISTDGRHGIPASAFRSGLISACRLVGFQMTRAKLGLFIEADGFDASDGTPLVYIEGEPEHIEHSVRNAGGGADIRVRAMWRKWSVHLRVRFDADMFSLEHVANLLARLGMQVGIGEGRPDSKQSAGMGWGTFTITGGDK
jgi:hypothetical protein